MWEERYGAEEYAYGKEPNDFLVEQLARLQANNCLLGNHSDSQETRPKILCIAEGEGRNAVFLAKQGFDVVAVDSSKAGMKKAEKLAAENGVKIETIVSDLSEFEFLPESYDAVVSIFCHLPKALRQEVHRQVVKALKPGGFFLLEAYTPDQLIFKTGGPAVTELTMTLDDLLDELAGLDVIYSAEREREVVEGLYHTGMGAVVQLAVCRS